jgi:hypothetical protein
LDKLLNCGRTSQKREKKREIEVRNTTNRYKYTNTTSWGGNPIAVNKYHVRVKQSRYRPEQAQRVDRGIAPSFLNLGARRGWVVSNMPRPLYPLGKTRYQHTGGWVGPRAGLDVCEKSRPHQDVNIMYRVK